MRVRHGAADEDTLLQAALEVFLRPEKVRDKARSRSPPADDGGRKPVKLSSPRAPPPPVFVVIEDRRAALGADIRPLAIELGRVLVGEEHVEQLLVAHLRRVVFDLNHLGMAGSAQPARTTGWRSCRQRTRPWHQSRPAPGGTPPRRPKSPAPKVAWAIAPPRQRLPGCRPSTSVGDTRLAMSSLKVRQAGRACCALIVLYHVQLKHKFLARIALIHRVKSVKMH